MKSCIVTMWLNEEDLAPFFLKHYASINRIFVLLDSASNDRTRQLCIDANNVRIIDFSFDDMFDADIKRHMINDFYRRYSEEYDWIMALDADEFVFFDTGFYPIPNEVNVLRARFWQVYQHITEGYLDINKPVKDQRRYGDADMSHNLNYMYIKPCIARGGISNFAWGIGSHDYVQNQNVIESPYVLTGAHWRMADCLFAIKRRLLNKARQSKNNLSSGYQAHDHNVTAEEIIQECKEHENDPQLF